MYISLKSTVLGGVGDVWLCFALVLFLTTLVSKLDILKKLLAVVYSVWEK